MELRRRGQGIDVAGLLDLVRRSGEARLEARNAGNKRCSGAIGVRAALTSTPICANQPSG